MKILAIMILFSVNSFAANEDYRQIFKPDSIIPHELQIKIIDKYGAQCGGTNNHINLQEVSSTSEVRKVSPDITESATYVVYTTEMSADYDVDPQHPGPLMPVKINVESMSQNLSDPYAEHYSVTSLNSDGGECQ